MSPSIGFFEKTHDKAMAIDAVVAGEAFPDVHPRVPAVFQEETMGTPVAGRVAAGDLATRVDSNQATVRPRCDRIRWIE